MLTRLGVIVLAGPDNGGTYQYTLSMLQALQYVSGFDITIYGDPENRDLMAFGYPICRFSESRARQIGALVASRAHVGLNDPFAAEDILLAPIYSLALLHTAKPFVFTLHDLQEHYYPENFSWWQRNWRYQVYARLLNRARRVICESRQVKADIIRLFGVGEQQAVVITAPPLQQFVADASPEQLADLRSRLRLPERYLFYPAQFWPHKNHLRLIEAFQQAVAEIPDLKLVLTGKKRDEYETVMAAIHRFGLNDHVIHLGYVEQGDLQGIYRLATALVMPSLFESVSIPIYEAFQVGTPVAASGILAMPEQVGDDGLLFDPMSTASIAQAMLKITGDPVMAKRLGQQGKDKMLSMTPQRYGAELQAMLDALRPQAAGAGPHPA